MRYYIKSIVHNNVYRNVLPETGTITLDMLDKYYKDSYAVVIDYDTNETFNLTIKELYDKRDKIFGIRIAKLGAHPVFDLYTTKRCDYILTKALKYVGKVENVNGASKMVGKTDSFYSADYSFFYDKECLFGDDPSYTIYQYIKSAYNGGSGRVFINNDLIYVPVINISEEGDISGRFFYYKFRVLDNKLFAKALILND